MFLEFDRCLTQVHYQVFVTLWLVRTNPEIIEPNESGNSENMVFNSLHFDSR